MAKSPEEYAHLEWLGYVQPIGLVVSVPAMLEAQCYINKNIIGEHVRFLECLLRDKNDEIIPEIADFAAFTQKCFGWEVQDLREVPERVALLDELSSLEVILPQYHETLRPTHAVPSFKPMEGESPWQMLIQVLPTGEGFDEPSESDSSRHWQAAPQLKFERLLRETQVPIGLLTNSKQLRLVYAPRGESSGHATFNVDEMVQVAGRPMFAALHMLLSADRMFTLGEKQRLSAILANSRKYQNTVSIKLAEQVLAALYELMRGLQSANDVRKGELLREVLAGDPNRVYSGLLRVLMRLVFVLYAEDRDLMSGDSVYSNNYSITGLFERLREDAGRFPDTMDSRFGAWSQLLTLFRLVYEGGQHGSFKLPPRKGYLFDPDRYPFLEGRTQSFPAEEPEPVPRISDGVVFRVLRNLLILDGERLSYRTLDVEQIGSVYETVMGFNLEVAQGKSIAIKPTKSHGAPATIDLDALLEANASDRAKLLAEISDQSLGGGDAAKLKEAKSIEELLDALDKKIAKKVTPQVVSPGAIVLQPSDERRRSGSHYTPRSLTEPIVRTTLEPILKALADPEADLPAVYESSSEDKKRYTAGELAARVHLSERNIEYAKQARQVGRPHPAQILDLKICDPAMGSGAFLVETCRQLGDELIKAWHAHDLLPTDIPADEDEVLYARRLVAQRCLYGVDKNDMAVDLAKLSLWLLTLAKDHPFTFLDHSLRHGDSLIGLTRRQIIGFHWEPKKQKQFGEDLIQKRLDRATEARAKILNAREDVPYRDQERRLAVADEALNVVRLTGDACVSAFFAGSKPIEREDCCEELFGRVSDWYASNHDSHKRGHIAAAAASLRNGEHPISPFHWEIEFPEVFSRENGGFDAFVGNPPFMGGTIIAAANGKNYLGFLKATLEDSGDRADLVAYFFRRAFSLLRNRAAFGLLATNTIYQGDTRFSGLRWICKHDGAIFSANRRFRWPGEAAVIVSVVHVWKGAWARRCSLNGRDCERISAYLFHTGSDENPNQLRSNSGGCFEGFVPYGAGFLFCDQTTNANSLQEMHDSIDRDPRNKAAIFPYLGGEELNDDPQQRHHRYVIYFEKLDEASVRSKWPILYEIVKERVKPERESKSSRVASMPWWQFLWPRPELRQMMLARERVLVCSKVSKYLSFAFVSTDVITSNRLAVFAIDSMSGFACLQSRVHQSWAYFFGSTLKDDPVYAPSDCFETFPFPKDLATNVAISAAGTAFYQFRAELMMKNCEGLTKTYNRFHDPQEKSPGIDHLRELHEAMDRAVLETYGWGDLARSARCEFLLDYEEDDENESDRKSKKKKPWRLRWADEFRDEVLARLLELNEQRAMEEKLAGKTIVAETKAVSSNGRGREKANRPQPGLFKE